MKIEEYAKEHIKNLKETNQGHNLVGDCPRPTCRQEGGLYITPSEQRFDCYACGAKGYSLEAFKQFCKDGTNSWCGRL
ncbi:MAG: hypothetical protein LBJ98_02610 [Endomicrobium sp.]|jgi:hypothetical protein|nr:hypothetical protein [Endomicrobium sp.]